MFNYMHDLIQIIYQKSWSWFFSTNIFVDSAISIKIKSNNKLLTKLILFLLNLLAT